MRSNACVTESLYEQHKKSPSYTVGMKILLLFLFFFSAIQVMAQSTIYDSVNRKRYQIAKTGFTVLGSWAVLNIGTGLIGQQNTSGERKQFYKANVIGGLVDLLFAGVGYINTKNMARQPHSVYKTFKRQALAEKLFLFSVGLDLGAITYGVYTKERADRFIGEKRDWLKGAGKALILQGAFLTLFDGILYLLQAKNGSQLYKTLQNLSFDTTENGSGLVYRF